MKIGMIRHFKVDLPFNKPNYTPEQFNAQMSSYDTAPVCPKEVDMKGYKWSVCYSSDLPRAVTTARAVCQEKFIQTPLLREVPLKAFTSKNIKLPGFIWHLAGRISWRKGGISQPENFNETIKRIEELISVITTNGDENILLVTHGFFMRVFQEYMKKKGFKGEVDFRPVNGKLYIISDNNL